MTAKMTPVIDVTDAILVSSTVPETDHPVWAVGTTYALAANVIKGHKIWESVQAGNLGNDPETDDGTWWTEGLATNRWKVFDGYLQDQTSQATSAEWVLTPGQYFDTVAFLNINAAAVQIVIDDPAEGEVYNETYDLVDNSAVFDGWSYFFAPIIQRSNFCVSDLPPYQSATMTITFTGTTVFVGQIAMGLAEVLGFTSNQMPIGIEDYTRLNEDTFGRTSPVVRGYARTATPMVVVDRARVRYLERVVADQRGIPTIWSFDTPDGASDLVYLGFFRRFSMVYQYANKATFDLEIRSLV